MDRTNRPLRMRFRSKIAALLIVGCALLVALPAMLVAQEGYELKIPLGLDEDLAVIPKANPLTKSKVELGKLLFFDNRLSKNNTVACASCHKPELAFTDGQAVSMGIHRQQGTRSAPISVNRVFSSAQFWDGRASTLEEQSVGPFINPIEHGFTDHDEMIAKLRTIQGYKPYFERAFGSERITIDRVGQAIASFQRTLLSGNSPYDRFDYGGEKQAISPSAKRGLALFLGKARCSSCHFGFNFTDERFHNLGIDWDTGRVDLGRYMVSKDPKDIGAFKTPTLREIARTAPYMHDGRFATLRDVVEFYNQGGIKNPHRDPLVLVLNLSEQEKSDIVEFLSTLSGEGWETEPPSKFPMEAAQKDRS